MKNSILIKLCIFTIFIVNLTSCSNFKAKRVDSAESDERAMEITDKWVAQDTTNVVKDVLKQIDKHRGFKRYLAKNGGVPKVFIGEIQNLTSEAYFPINDINDELLNELSASGNFILIDANARDKILGEITYQNDGMVDPNTAKNIGKQTGADIMIFGNIYMKPETRSGKTIKEYRVNVRMTDIEKAVEVMRARAKLSKYSEQSGSGW
ncbi:penicillin-binding protein activator LpoB [Bacteriovoracaceae bacterium]|nr:penicillin-binding protein activator LpoB [Bacteriovoracaceae bacterium]